MSGDEKLELKPDEVTVAAGGDSDGSGNGDGSMMMDRVRSKRPCKAGGPKGPEAAPTSSALGSEVLEQTRQEHIVHFECGRMTEGQHASDEREREALPSEATRPENFPAISCRKGFKGPTCNTPNQDNWSVTYFKNGYAMICCMDGHGNEGHEVSTHAVKVMPHFFITSKHLETNVCEALTEAFERTQEDIVAQAWDEGWDCWSSGTTAVVTVWRPSGNKLWTAHVGDSRSIIGEQKSRKVFFQTEDHVPSSETEQARILATGADIRSEVHAKHTSTRIYLPGSDEPGLAMCRSLGDCIVKKYGVTATPQCSEIEVDMETEPFLLMGSDGVFEFMTSENVVKEIAKKMKSEGTEKVCDRIAQQARKEWERVENFAYCDDITAIVMKLR